MSSERFKKRHQVPVTLPYNKLLGKTETVNSQSVTVLEKDSSGNILRCSGTVTITDAGSGYSKGCVYIKTDVSTGIQATYENIGTSTSCNFDLQGGVISDNSITSAKMDAGVKKVVTTTIPTAEVLALNTTPKELVPAPGAGKYLIVDRITASVDYNSAAYATNTTLEFKYGTATTKCTADIASLLDATTDKVQTVGGMEAELSAGINDNIEANVATGDPITGDSDIKVVVEYRELSI